MMRAPFARSRGSVQRSSSHQRRSVVRAGQSPSGRPARSTLPAAAPRFSLERRAVPVSCQTRECRTFPRLLPHCAAAHVLP